MKGTIELYTDRLVLRRYKMEDAAALHRFFGIDEKMYEYSGWNPYATEEMADSAVKQFIDSYRDPSFYGWAVELKKDPGSGPETACELYSTRKRGSQESPEEAKAADRKSEKKDKRQEKKDARKKDSEKLDMFKIG